MFNKIVAIALLLALSCLSSPALAAGLPGSTDTVFNKKFVYKIKPLMPYEQLVTIAGGPGKKLSEGKGAAPTLYHWDGARKTALDAKVEAGKVVEATVTSPKGKKFARGKKGELLEW